jgi:uncharacterized Tic20 family protein
MIENVNPEELVGGAETFPAPEPPAEPVVEMEPEPIAGAAGYPIVEPAPETTVITAPATAQPLSASDERTWAMLAHLSVLANLVTGVLGPFIALIIYLVYRDRSRYVAYQSMQAFIFQLITWVGSGVLIGGIWLVTGLLSIVVVGILLIPFALIGTICLGILPLVGLIYGIVGAIETSQGKDFQYWLVGDWARGLH